ncbi:GTP-binding protein [Confluentibacter flavum]|uniref:GTP-binding protein n=1 Tax=Confluentibacter flavum TaxID=1909700 RepID=A0A2N3HPS6_9FLAO|nr:GTP-binding protein [Confluentibacter flavum]PKQ46931.1 GTP-binding protein [Confluentibacter flavum]
MLSKNDIALRPRFKFEINKDKDTVLNAFVEAKSAQSLFIITRIDDHVFIRKSNVHSTFWSPQLQIEVNKIEEHSSSVSGLVGPNPTVWTLFMFLHFMVAGLFIAFGIWAYTNISLNTSYIIQISFMLLMVIIWFLLYFVGRIGKDSSDEEINDLYVFMQKTIG